MSQYLDINITRIALDVYEEMQETKTKEKSYFKRVLSGNSKKGYDITGCKRAFYEYLRYTVLSKEFELDILNELIMSLKLANEQKEVFRLEEWQKKSKAGNIAAINCLESFNTGIKNRKQIKYQIFDLEEIDGRAREREVGAFAIGIKRLFFLSGDFRLIFTPAENSDKYRMKHIINTIDYGKQYDITYEDEDYVIFEKLFSFNMKLFVDYIVERIRESIEKKEDESEQACKQRDKKIYEILEPMIRVMTTYNGNYCKCKMISYVYDELEKIAVTGAETLERIGKYMNCYLKYLDEIGSIFNEIYERVMDKAIAEIRRFYDIDNALQMLHHKRYQTIERIEIDGEQWLREYYEAMRRDNVARIMYSELVNWINYGEDGYKIDVEDLQERLDSHVIPGRKRYFNTRYPFFGDYILDDNFLIGDEKELDQMIIRLIIQENYKKYSSK